MIAVSALYESKVLEYLLLLKCHLRHKTSNNYPKYIYIGIAYKNRKNIKAK